MGIKMVLRRRSRSEVFGGYLYFHKAPTPQAFHRRNRAQALQTVLPSVRLPPCQQKPCSLGSGRTSALPRQRIPGCCHAHQSGSQDVPRQGDRKESSPRSLCDILPRALPGGRKNSSPTVSATVQLIRCKAVTAAAVSDEQMARAAERFPDHSRKTRKKVLPSRLRRAFPVKAQVRSVPAYPVWHAPPPKRWHGTPISKERTTPADKQ